MLDHTRVFSLVLVLTLIADSFAAEAPSFEPFATTPSCTVQLEQTPPDGKDLCIYFNNTSKTVPQNPRDGWTFNANRTAVTFHGSACEGIQTGRIVDIDIVCGCQAR